MFGKKLAFADLGSERKTVTAGMQAAAERLHELISARRTILERGTPDEMRENATAQDNERIIIEMGEARMGAIAQAEQAKAFADDQAIRQTKYDAGVKAQAAGRAALIAYSSAAEEVTAALLQLAAAERVICEANTALPEKQKPLDPAEQPRNDTAPSCSADRFPLTIGTAHVCIVDRVVLPKISRSRDDYFFGAENTPKQERYW